MKQVIYLKCIIAGAALALSLAMSASAEDFNIPSGDLANALDLYATRTGVQLIYDDSAVHGVQTKGCMVIFPSISRFLASLAARVSHCTAGPPGLLLSCAATGQVISELVHVAAATALGREQCSA